MTITASIIIDSPKDTVETIEAYIDSRADGYNDGDTSFNYNDQPAFLISKTDGLIIKSVEISIGNLAFIEKSNYRITEILEFPRVFDSTISKLYKKDSAFSNLILTGQTNGIILDKKKATIKTNEHLTAVQVEYTTEYWAYKITNLPQNIHGITEYPIIIYVTGEEV